MSLLYCSVSDVLMCSVDEGEESKQRNYWSLYMCIYVRILDWHCLVQKSPFWPDFTGGQPGHYTVHVIHLLLSPYVVQH